jgi:glutaredoxin
MTRHFVVHTIPQCKWCALAKHELRKRGIPFELKYHNDLDERAEFKKQHNVTTFPLIVFMEPDGSKFGKWTVIGGYTELMTYLEAPNDP